MIEFLIITGVSGAGRSTVADAVDDLGWFVIDNVPLPLFARIVELTQGLGEPFERIAFVLGTDVRGSDGPESLVDAIEMMRSNANTRVVYVDASDDVLIRRYEETRRRHPQFSGGSLLESIRAERQSLENVRAVADLVFDTSDLNLHELRGRIMTLFAVDAQPMMQLRISSFGYKRGIPVDADVVMDCRFLPNPHWREDLRSLSGLDESVRTFVVHEPAAEQFISQFVAMLGALLPAYRDQGRTYLSLAFGCTGGRHRSVAVANEVARRLSERGIDATVGHRDIDK